MSEERPTTNGALTSRRAVEALRSGVPSHDAVAALGAGQPEIEDRFSAALSKAQGGADRPQPSGLLVGADFGAGKSHLLTYLGGLALARGFVTSTVVISKETPLHDLVKVLRAAVESAQVAGGLEGAALGDAAALLDPASPGFAELSRWAHAPGSELDGRFAATLYVFGQLQHTGDEEAVDRLVGFWAGEPLFVTDLRRMLRELGQRNAYELGPVSQRALARQRLRFLSRLFVAAGFAGWVVLVDEVELIGRYSVLQRGRAYAELGRWARADHADPALPLVAALAMTDDFEEAVLRGKDDLTAVPERLAARPNADAGEIAAAGAGMAAIGDDLVHLVQPDDAELDRIYDRLKALHGAAFGWDPPDVPGLERLAATRVRQYVRAWINEWDLVRLDPEYAPATEVVEVDLGYEEQPELERPASRAGGWQGGPAGGSVAEFEGS